MTYTTGAVSGMTGIPVKTMQRYVKDFRDCFSETARQPRKGRRFTDGDIRHLLTIRRDRSKRMNNDQIREAISGADVLPVEGLALAVQTLELAERVEKALRAMKREKSDMQALYSFANRRVEELTDKVAVLEQRINPPPRVREEPKTPEPPKKKGLFG